MSNGGCGSFFSGVTSERNFNTESSFEKKRKEGANLLKRYSRKFIPYGNKEKGGKKFAHGVVGCIKKTTWHLRRKKSEVAGRREVCFKLRQNENRCRGGLPERGRGKKRGPGASRERERGVFATDQMDFFGKKKPSLCLLWAGQLIAHVSRRCVLEEGGKMQGGGSLCAESTKMGQDFKIS